MLGRRLSTLIFHQCATSQQQLQHWCCAAVACLSTSAAHHAAAAAAAEATTANAPDSQGAAEATTTAAAAAAAAANSTQRKSWLGAKQQQLLSSSFEQLHKEVQQQFALQSAQSESTLLVLINKATQAEQVQAAVDAVRVNHLKRCRIRQAQMFSPHVFNALAKAGHRAGLGHSFALQLLEQANQLGLQTSRGICEDVLASCLKQEDYAAAGKAWVYAQLYCATPSSSSSSVDESNEPPPAAAAAAGAGSTAQGGWASTSMIKVYLSGMSQWLVEGGLSHRHKQRLCEQLKELVKELQNRGAKIPKSVNEALEAATASSSSSSNSSSSSSSSADFERVAAAAEDGDRAAETESEAKPSM